jgi:hypothetical protein
VLLHEARKILEEIVRIVRAGCGFGVVLNAEDGLGFVLHAFDGVVVQVHVGDFDLRVFEGIRVYAEAMVLRSDFDFAGTVVDDGMVGAVMSEFQLVGLAAERQAKDLMAETDAKDRRFADKLFDLRCLMFEGFRISRAVGKEDAIGAERENIFSGRVRGDDGDARAYFDKVAEDVALNAVIVGDDVEMIIGASGYFVGR